MLLLDEIEKAHPEVFNLLLQVMDHGTLTDNNGRKTDFRHVVLVMTTNAGADQISRRSIGFSEQDHTTDGMEALNKLFTPEFRNRLDSIIQFAPLSRDTVCFVVDKFLTELQAQLDEKRVALDVDETARSWLVTKGYDEIRVPRFALEIGESSYAIYLTHPFIIGATSILFSRFQLIDELSPLNLLFTYSLAVIIVSLAVGYLVHYLFDLPFTNWLRHRWFANAMRISPVR